MSRPAIRYGSLYTARPPMLEARRQQVFGPLSKPRLGLLHYCIISALVVLVFAVTVFCTVGPGAV